MTPEEKAQELVKKFMPNMYCFMGSGMLTNDYSESVAKGNAKECAIWMIDEILESKPSRGYLISGAWVTDGMFWNEVKEEINKL